MIYKVSQCVVPAKWEESWWYYDMKMLSALLVLCEGTPPVTDGFPSQKASNTCFYVAFVISLNKLQMKQLSWQWIEMPKWYKSMG